VRISNIEIINETKDALDPFIRFIVGGSFYILIKNRGKNEVHEKKGKMGVVHTTEVCKFLEPGDSRFLNRRIETFYSASYF
jgi:hypothetical protein